MMSKEIRAKFLDFFKKKGHTIVPSSSLISDDHSVLFTTAGMQQFKPYYLGEKSPYGENAASVQKCFRTSDIDSVGDESHLTFFEMLGNFSFGGYFKEKAIEYTHEFITSKEWMGLKIEYVTIFDGGKLPKDDWRKIGTSIDQQSYETWHEIFKNEGLNEEEIRNKIRREGIDNFWGPTGDEGPCGPTTEIYVKNSDGKAIEIWNIVFNQYYCDKNKKLKFLETFGVNLGMVGIDTGMGLERLTMVVQNKPTIFETDLFEPIFEFLNENLSSIKEDWIKRIIADHIRSIIFLIADGVLPSNKDQGYVLRRLMRRLMPYFSEFDFFEPLMPGEKISAKHKIQKLNSIAEHVINVYSQFEEYKYLAERKTEILNTIEQENEKFDQNYQKNKLILEKIILKSMDSMGIISGKDIFDLVTTYGFSIEWLKDIAKMRGLKLEIDLFEKLFKKHQEISRAGLEKKFGGHGLKEGGEMTGATEEEKQKIVRLHTATHLLHQALFDLFGDKIKQMGSDINSERFRFDFPFERKLTAEELAKLEAIVNQKIKEALPVRFEEKTKEEAIAEGTKAFFKIKYPEKVKVYYINDYSKEICNGPHVKNTSEIGKFRILKEESVGAGIRRIKATVE